MSRRWHSLKMFAFAVAFALGAPQFAAAYQAVIPTPADLQAFAAQAAKEKKPLVVLFEAEDCPYCKRVMQEYLNPMSKSKEYQDKVRFLRVDVGSKATLKDFHGQNTTQADFARSFRVQLVPTVIVFAPNGRPVSDPIVGFSSPDYYGYYLDQAIDAGVAKVRGGK